MDGGYTEGGPTHKLAGSLRPPAVGSGYGQSGAATSRHAKPDSGGSGYGDTSNGRALHYSLLFFQLNFKQPFVAVCPCFPRTPLK